MQALLINNRGVVEVGSLNPVVAAEDIYTAIRIFIRESDKMKNSKNYAVFAYNRGAGVYAVEVMFSHSGATRWYTLLIPSQIESAVLF